MAEVTDDELEQLLQQGQDPALNKPEPLRGLQGVPHARTAYVTAEEARRRRVTMSNLVAAGRTDDEIVALFTANQLPNGEPGFGMSEVGTLALKREVVQLWAREEAASKAINRMQAIRRHLDHIQRARARGAFTAVAQLEKNLMALQGTAAPIELRVTNEQTLSEAVGRILQDADPAEVEALLADEIAQHGVPSQPPKPRALRSGSGP